MLTSPKKPPQKQAGSPVTLWLHLRSAFPGIRLSAVGGTVGARVVSSAFNFAAGIITARDLGTHGRALLAVAIAIPAIFGVFGVLGLDNANARFAGRSHSAFRQILRRSIIFSVTGGSAMAAAWGFAGLHWPALRLSLDPRLTMVSAAICPVSLLLNLLATAEIGRGRVSIYNVVMIGTAAAYLAGVLILLVSGRLSVLGCVIACGGSQLVGVITLLILATTRVHPDGERVALRRYTSYAFRAYLPNLAHYGMLRMDVPIIQALAGATAVALYAVALPIAEGVMLLPTAVALVIFPRVTAGDVGQESAKRIGQAVLVASAALVCVVSLASPVVIPTIYGTPYRGAVAVVWSMLPGLVLFSAARTQQAYLAATDKLNLVTGATVAGAAAGLVALITLAPHFGAAGAGAADSLGYFAFSVTVLGSLHRHGPVRRVLAWSMRPCRRHTWRGLSAAHGMRTTMLGCVAVAAGLIAALASTRAATLSPAVVVAIMLVVLTVPSAGLFVLAVACPLSQTSFGSSLVSEKFLIMLIIATVISGITAHRFFRPTTRAVALAVATVGYFLLSATLAGDINASHNWRYVMMLGAPLLLLPLIANGDTATRRALIIFGLSTAFLALAEIQNSRATLATSPNLSAANQAITAAINNGAVNHNAEGAIFVLALGVLLAGFSHARHMAEKLTLAGAIAALVIGIAYSFSRSAYFGALAIIVLFAARRSIRGLIAAAIAIGCLAPMLPAAVSARLASAWNPGGLDISSALRLDLWSSALRMFQAHPLFGVGYLNFTSQLPEYYVNTGSYSTTAIQFTQLDFAHNTYLTVLAMSGLVGAVLVGGLIVAGWRRVWAAAGTGNWAGEAALLGFLGVGVCSLFGEVLLVPPILTAFLLTVLATDRATRAVT